MSGGRATIAAWQLSCKPNVASAFGAVFDDNCSMVTTISRERGAIMLADVLTDCKATGAVRAREILRN